MAINRTAKTWGAEEATSTDMNAEIKALWDGLQAPWDSYTPVRHNGVGGSALTIGNGTITGGHLRQGKTIDFFVLMTVGSSTGTGSTIWTFELPYAPAVADQVGGAGVIYDASAGIHIPITWFGVSGLEVEASRYDGTLIRSNGPITWASGDKIKFWGRYEAS